MSAGLLALLAWLALAPPRDDTPLGIDVELASDAVELGRAFDLVVVRRFAPALEPAPWNDRELLPLAVESLGCETSVQGDATIERRRFRARLWQREDATLAPSIEAVARADGIRRAAHAPARTLHVRSTLPADSPGEIELPRGPFGPPSNRGRIVLLAAALSAAALVVLRAASRRRARRAARPAAGPIAESQDAAFDRALGALRAQAAAAERLGVAADEAFHLDAARLVRALVAATLPLRATARTTEELLDDGALPAPIRAAISAALPRCDRVLFARRASRSAERIEVVDAVARLASVRADRGAAGSAT